MQCCPQRHSKMQMQSIQDFAGAKVTSQAVSIWLPLVKQIPDVQEQPGLGEMSELFVGCKLR